MKPVNQAPSATESVALSSDAQRILDMFNSLPNDPFVKAEVMGGISALIKAARDTHQAKQQATAKVYQFPKQTTAK